jgi:hypothetical protein
VPTQQDSKKQFMSQGADQRQVKLEFRSLASPGSSLAVWLDQEEELVQLVPQEWKALTTRAKQKLLKTLNQLNYLCRRRDCFK